jgi:hypothetical protein
MTIGVTYQKAFLVSASCFAAVDILRQRRAALPFPLGSRFITSLEGK